MTRWMLLVLGLAACNGPADDSTDDTDAPGETDVTDDGPFADHPLRTQRILNVAHRGGALIGPESTIPTMQAAIEAGAHVLEIDVHSTADGQLVVLHDDSVDRTTDGTGPIRSLTLAEARLLDAGYRFTSDGGATFPHRDGGYVIPTLEEVFSAFPDVLYSVEIKQQSPSIVDAVLAAIDAHGLRERVVVGAFDDAVVHQVRAAAPDVLTTLGFQEGMNLYLLPEEAEADYVPPSPYFAAPLEFNVIRLTQADVEKARRLGVTLHVWTVNDPDEMDLVIAWGADGIITDDPVTLQGKLEAAGGLP